MCSFVSVTGITINCTMLYVKLLLLHHAPRVLCLSVADPGTHLYECLPSSEQTRISTSQSSLVCLRCLGLLEPFMEGDQPTKWPSVRTFTMITVVTPWMRSPLFQSTMADPVIVILVTIRIIKRSRYIFSSFIWKTKLRSHFSTSTLNYIFPLILL